MGTEYAIRIVTTNPSVPILPTPYAELVNPEIPGEAQFTSGESVWLSTAGWFRADAGVGCATAHPTCHPIESGGSSPPVRPGFPPSRE